MYVFPSIGLRKINTVAYYKSRWTTSVPFKPHGRIFFAEAPLDKQECITIFHRGG